MKLLITGASGHLGCYLLQEALRAGHAVTAWTGRTPGEFLGVPFQPVDLTDKRKVVAAFQRARPEVVIHAAALARVADCFGDPELARRINQGATAFLAELCEGFGTRLIFTSTDMVFDGEKGNYREADEPRPLSVYGQTKLAGEEAILAFPEAAVVRLSLLFGPSLCAERPTFFDQQQTALRNGEPIRCFNDEWRTPLSLAAAAGGLLQLAAATATGLFHLGGLERLSRFDMGLRLARDLGVSDNLVLPIRREDLAAPEPRPRDVSLDSSWWRSYRFP